MRVPNFLVIGAPRSGTTTLHYSLGQHPEIFVSPEKETNFFLFDGPEQPPSGIAEADFAAMRHRSAITWAAYGALFAGASDAHRAIGEASPAYFVCPEVAARIRARLPEVRLIAILRQPVEQALSLYMVRQGGSAPGAGLIEGFTAALAADGARGRRDGLALAEYGLYHRHLSAFLEHFARDRIKVVLLEDLERDESGFFADLFRFLGVDDAFRPDLSRRYNPTGAARSAALHRLLSGSPRLKGWLRGVLPPSAASRPDAPASPPARRQSAPHPEPAAGSAARADRKLLWARHRGPRGAPRAGSRHLARVTPSHSSRSSLAPRGRRGRIRCADAIRLRLPDPPEHGILAARSPRAASRRPRAAPLLGTFTPCLSHRMPQRPAASRLSTRPPPSSSSTPFS